MALQDGFFEPQMNGD